MDCGASPHPPKKREEKEGGLIRVRTGSKLSKSDKKCPQSSPSPDLKGRELLGQIADVIVEEVVGDA